MFRLDSDQVNWVLVAVLAAMALLLALVSSTGHGAPLAPDRAWLTHEPVAIRGVNGLVQEPPAIRTTSEAWYVARELYTAKRYEDAHRAFDRVAAKLPSDPALRIWAGMAAYRVGDLETAVRHWDAVWCDESPTSDCELWSAVALAAAHLKAGRVDHAARLMVPMALGDSGAQVASHPLVTFYAAQVYERLATTAWDYPDALHEKLALDLAPALASADRSTLASPNSRSWLVFLTKRALKSTIRWAPDLDLSAPLVPDAATLEPSLAPTTEELLDALGAADFMFEAIRGLRALELYESPPPIHFELDSRIRIA